MFVCVCVLDSPLENPIVSILKYLRLFKDNNSAVEKLGLT
jgi:hypothetical protein